MCVTQSPVVKGVYFVDGVVQKTTVVSLLGLAHSITNRLGRKYKWVIEKEELEAEARLALVESVSTQKPGWNQATWTAVYIKSKLQNLLSRRIHATKLFCQMDHGEGKHNPQFDLTSFIKGIPEDSGRVVLKLLEKAEQGTRVKNIRMSVTAELKKEGWTGDRILKAMGCIREALAP